MGTTAGLIVGARLAGLKSRVIGVKVSMTEYSNVRGTISLANKTAALMRLYDPAVPEMKFTPADFDLELNFFGGEYGRVTPEGEAAVDLVKKTEDIGLETTYTGKTLAAVLDFVKKDKSLNGAPVLFWNTYNSVDYSETVRQCGGYKTLPRNAQWVCKDNLIPYLK